MHRVVDLAQYLRIGRLRAAEYVRDTHGDKPVEKVDVSAQVMTDEDRALMDRLAARLDDPSIVIAKDVTGSDDG